MKSRRRVNSTVGPHSSTSASTIRDAMFLPVLTLIDYVLGRSLDTVGKLKELEPTKRRQAAQGLLSFYKDLEKLKLSASYIKEEVDIIITFHRRGEYDRHTIENYVGALNSGHAETMEILSHMFLWHRIRLWLPWARGVHVRNIVDFLEIKDPELAIQIDALLGIKYQNLMVLLTCFDLIHKKQSDKSLRTLKYISGIDISRLRQGQDLLYSRRLTLDKFEQRSIVKTESLDASRMDQLLLFSQGVDHFLTQVDIVREKIRKFMADNFTIEEIL